MESTRSPYIKHIYVCVNQRDPGVTCCASGGASGAASASGSHAAEGRSGFASSGESHAHGGGEGIRDKLKAFVNANGLKGKVRVSQSGCMDLCAQGPNVMVYPDYQWYRHVTLEDVDRIIEEHLAPLVIASPTSASLSAGSGTKQSRDDGKLIQAFLFDLGNVLVRFDHMRAAQGIAAKTKVTPEELFRFIFDSPLVMAHDEGKITSQRFYEGLKEAVGLSTSFKEFLEVWSNIFTEDEEMETLVRELSSRYPCYIISNTNRPHFDYIRQRYPILRHFLGYVLSYEVGVLKPHPMIYQRALELIRVPPHQILYIDDREDLIEAGRGMGLQVHRFTQVHALRKDLKERGIEISSAAR